MCQGNSFCGKPTENDEHFFAILEKYSKQEGMLIPILQETQNVYGYLPKEAIIKIAKATDVPVSSVYGVVTFYSQFHLTPRGENVIKICQGTACHVRGGKKILDFIQDYLKVEPGKTTKDGKFTLEIVACIGACGLAPVFMVNEDTYGKLTEKILPEILSKY